MKENSRTLQMYPIKNSEHLYFNLLSFYFFKTAKATDMLSMVLYFFPHLTVVPYVLTMEIILIRRRRYFVRLRDTVVGLFALRERPDTLYISTLAVAPEYRKHGIATNILEYSAKTARLLRKSELELAVSKMNMPALRLYRKFGFALKKQKKWTLILGKRVKNH